jgi:hypothetical protein
MFIVNLIWQMLPYTKLPSDSQLAMHNNWITHLKSAQTMLHTFYMTQTHENFKNYVVWRMTFVVHDGLWAKTA